MSTLTFRPARVEDATPLSALVNSAYRGDSSRQGWTTEADLLDGQRVNEPVLVEMMGRPGSVILLCQRDGELAGCVYLERREAGAYLGMLTVRPDLQAAGIGRHLLGAAEAHAAMEWHAAAIVMTVIHQRTELIAWYERRGYRDTGRREPFPSKDQLSVRKVDNLDMVVLSKPLPPPGA